MSNKYKNLQEILWKIKQSDTFEQYFSTQEQLLSDTRLLALIAEYRQAKDDYSAVVVRKAGTQEKEKYRAVLNAQKEAFDQEPLLRNYYRSARFVELYLDDINYELNQILTVSKGCH